MLVESTEYTFSDSGVRNLKFVFLNDSLIQISNRVSGLQTVNYYIYDFTTKYRFKRIDYFRYVIGKPIGKSDTLGTARYTHPYRKKGLLNRADVFPNVVNDTLFFNENWTSILIKDFCFELKKK